MYVRKFGYSEVNLNSGCPSSKVQKGCFGAILMKSENRDLLAEIVDAMWKGWKSEDLKGVDNKPKFCDFDEGVTLKCRIGVDDEEGYDFIKQYIQDTGDKKSKDSPYLSRKGVNHFIVHARKAFLQGLNPD